MNRIEDHKIAIKPVFWKCRVFTSTATERPLRLVLGTPTERSTIILPDDMLRQLWNRAGAGKEELTRREILEPDYGSGMYCCAFSHPCEC